MNVDSLSSTNILWLQSDSNLSDFRVQLQGGVIVKEIEDTETFAFGTKVDTEIAGLIVSGAGSWVDNGGSKVLNFVGTFSPLFTQMIDNGNEISFDNYTGTIGVQYGDFSTRYGYTSYIDRDGEFQEVDVVWTKNLGSIDLYTCYIFTDTSSTDEQEHKVRAWVKYNF